MSSIATAFMILAVISGFSLFCVAFDSTMYTSMPYGRWKWLTGLLLATILFTFIAVLASGRGCEDYTANDYKYGYVPISCPKATEVRNGTN